VKVVLSVKRRKSKHHCVVLHTAAAYSRDPQSTVQRPGSLTEVLCGFPVANVSQKRL
jgi:hypothetical protein